MTKEKEEYKRQMKLVRFYRRKQINQYKTIISKYKPTAIKICKIFCNGGIV